jgi:hypothetical protein
MAQYNDSYYILQTLDSERISESHFRQLINSFRENYLESVEYFQGSKKHRKPISFLNGVLNDLYTYHRKMQERPELKDYDEKKNCSGYVAQTIIEIWEADKKLKTLYKAIENYCSLRSRNFNTIAVHIAEYRAINKLITRIRKEINRIDFDKSKFAVEASKKLEEVEERRRNAKVFCYHCNRETKQATLFEKGELAGPTELVIFNEGGKRENSLWTIEGRIWKLFQCQGCENINLNVFMRHSPFEDDVLIHHFPAKDFRPFPMWATHLNREFTELFCEIYLSLNAGSTRLPLMGARTLLDMFIVEKIGDQGSFKNKLQKLVDQKYISDSSRELLEVALEYGHATIHRGYQPNKDEINGVLDIIENILHSEALKAKTKDLKISVTGRG